MQNARLWKDLQKGCLSGDTDDKEDQSRPTCWKMKSSFSSLGCRGLALEQAAALLPFSSAGRTENRGAEWRISIFSGDRLEKAPLLSLSTLSISQKLLKEDQDFLLLWTVWSPGTFLQCADFPGLPTGFMRELLFYSLFSCSLAPLPPPTLHLSCLTSGDQSCQAAFLRKGHWAFA